MQRINEKDRVYRGGDWGIKYLFRGPRIDWGVLLLKPGQKMGAHGHKEVEETFYFLQGFPRMLINDVEYRAAEGDAFRVEPMEKHDIVNDTDKVVRVVFIKTPYLPDDKIEY
jgi:mannose-6-phosphate isomerase-like protein (cupin superfamily)